MSYEKYQYTILCEDRNQYHFVRGWLEERGVSSRGKIEVYGDLPHPGSGKDYVQGHFEMALNKLRSKQSYQKRVLIVVVDADNESYDQAKNNSAFSCSAPSDNVFIIVPRWSIETWVRWLSEQNHDEARDESKSCKTKYNEAPFKKLGKKLAEFMRTAAYDASNMPDSLERAILDVNGKIKSLAA